MYNIIMYPLSVLMTALIIASSIIPTTRGIASLASASSRNLIADYVFNGTAVVVRGYSSGSPTPVYMRLSVVSGTIKTHFLLPFIKYKAVFVCANSTSRPIVRGNSVILRTICTLRLPLVFNFNASVKVYRLSNGLIKAYLYLNMTYVGFLVKMESPRIGIINGQVATYTSGTFTFPPSTTTPLRVKFPGDLLSGIKLLYIFTERPSAYGAVVKVNGTYVGNILPFYVLWPSNISEYLSYKRRHAVMVFAGTGFKLKFSSYLNQVTAYVPYDISRMYHAVLTPLSVFGAVRNSSLSILVPSVSGMPITKIMVTTNITSVKLRYLRALRKALLSGEYSYSNVTAEYLTFPRLHVDIALPLVGMPQCEDIGFCYTLHYPIAMVSLPLPLHGKVAEILRGDAIILYGYTSNYYIIPPEKEIDKLLAEVVNQPSPKQPIPPYLIPALALGATVATLSITYISRRRRR